MGLERVWKWRVAGVMDPDWAGWLPVCSPLASTLDSNEWMGELVIKDPDRWYFTVMTTIQQPQTVRSLPCNNYNILRRWGSAFGYEFWPPGDGSEVIVAATASRDSCLSADVSSQHPGLRNRSSFRPMEVRMEHVAPGRLHSRPGNCSESAKLCSQREGRTDMVEAAYGAPNSSCLTCH